MNKLDLDPKLALSALRAHWSLLTQRNPGPYAPPAWRNRPAKPLAAWQANGRRPATREARMPTTLYLFEFDEPMLIGSRQLTGFVLACQDGGGFVEHWWQGTEIGTAVTMAALKL